MTSYTKQAISSKSFDTSEYHIVDRFYAKPPEARGDTTIEIKKNFESKKVLCKASSQCNLKFEIDIEELRMQRKIEKINKSK